LTAGIGAAVAMATYAVVHLDQPRNPGSDRSPTGVASAVSTSPPLPSPSRSPWPSAAGACGSTAFRPLMSPLPLAERIGVHVLVGGYGVRLVDANGGLSRPVGGIPTDARRTVSEMVSAGGVSYVLSVPCNSDAGRVYRLDNGARPLAGPPVPDLLAGADRVWAVEYPRATAGLTAPVLLRPLNGGRVLTLPSDAYPVADTGAGVVVAAEPLGPGRQPRIMLLSPATGRPVRTLGLGVPLAVDRSHLLSVLRPCDLNQANPSCTIARTDLRTGQALGRYHLPKGRVPVSAGSVSPDGRLVAFELARIDSDPRFDVGHPLPPSDVVVLHLDTGRLDIIQGLELAPKTGAGLIFTKDSRWLFIAVNDGDHMHLLAWRPGLAAPRSVARLPGPIIWTPSLLIV